MILNILLLTGCSLFGPRPALIQGATALNDGDLASFEEVVVLDEVLPPAAEGCARITLLEDWGERSQRQKNNPLAGIALAAGRGLLDGLLEAGKEDLVAQARAEFGKKPPGEYCPAIQAGDLTSARVERNGTLATAWLPIQAWGVETTVAAKMEKREPGGQVVDLDFEAAIAEIKQELERQATE
ncbi:MAG: hypothetical protein VX899_21290 [Myxococcota bacterium]|nr:hypothetical protein [Myxococcota bacterium]